MTITRFTNAGILLGVIAGLGLLGITIHHATAASSSPPNFEGMWQDAAASRMQNLLLIGTDLPYKPEGQNLAAERMKLFKQGRSVASAHLICRPTGVQGITGPKGPILILQTQEELVFFSQEDREVRHVYLNRSHPKDLVPSYSGDAVAHWEGTTLVIDTIGFNGRGQLDEMGNPHSNQLHVTERLTLNADGTYTTEMTIDDPVYYTKPFTIKRTWKRSAEKYLYDYDCAQNPRSDDFANLTFEDDWFKPVCSRPVKDNVAGDKVICNPQVPSTTGK